MLEDPPAKLTCGECCLSLLLLISVWWVTGASHRSSGLIYWQSELVVWGGEIWPQMIVNCFAFLSYYAELRYQQSLPCQLVTSKLFEVLWSFSVDRLNIFSLWCSEYIHCFMINARLDVIFMPIFSSRAADGNLDVVVAVSVVMETFKFWLFLYFQFQSTSSQTETQPGPSPRTSTSTQPSSKVAQSAEKVQSGLRPSSSFRVLRHLPAAEATILQSQHLAGQSLQVQLRVLGESVLQLTRHGLGEFQQS